MNFKLKIYSELYLNKEKEEELENLQENSFLRIIGNDDFMQDLLNKREVYVVEELKVEQNDLIKKAEKLRKNIFDFDKHEKDLRENHIYLDPIHFKKKAELENRLRATEIKEENLLHELDSVKSYYSSVIKKLYEQLDFYDKDIDNAKKKHFR